MVISLLLSALPLLAQAPTIAAPAPPQQIVVGTDDRRDFFEAPYPAVNLFASTGTIFTTGNYTLAPDGQSVTLNFNSWADKFLQRNEQYTGMPFSPPRPLCSTERYLTQNSTGTCSFTLIAPNLALTAGHCMTMPRCTPGSGPNQLNTCRLEDVAASNPGGVCANTIFAFDYQANDSSGSSPLILGPHQFRRCRRAVSLQSINFFNVGTDFALVELDGPVCDRPSILLASTTPDAGDPLILMGSSFGLPQKSAPHSFLGEVTGRYPWATGFPAGIFATSGESFGGNSGGGLFNSSGQLVSLLTASDARNFIERRPPGPSCFEFRRYSDKCESLPSSDPGVCFPSFSQPVSTLPADLLPPSFPNLSEGFCQVSAIKSVNATNSASFRPALAPDSLATLFGANLWPNAPWQATSLPLPQLVDQLEVRVNGVRAGLLYISATQINFLVPSSAAPTSGQPLARIDVIYRGRIIATQDNLVIRRTEPALYASNGFALGQHYSGPTPASLTDVPIARRSGNILVLYGTGFRRAPSLAALLNDVPLDVLYAGPAPGFAGLDQLNLRLTPAAVATLADGAIANLVLVTPESASPPVRLQFD